MQLPPPSNLQVLPKNISNPDLIKIMDGFEEALGVQCNYCHVLPAPAGMAQGGGAGPPGGAPAGAPPAAGGGRGGAAPAFRIDPKAFALDDKPEKKTARLMLKMVTDLNARIGSEVAPVLGTQAAELTRVQCATCHRGVDRPEQIADVLSKLEVAQGEDAAVSKYRELRTKYYGAQAYDFSEPMLDRVSQTSLGNNNPDNAMTWVNLNLEFYPNSSQTYVQMAQVYTRKADKNSAVQALQKAIQLDPGNMNAKRQLAQLQGGGGGGPGQ
jgi:tetratricopeptide (TPR) repeat protein